MLATRVMEQYFKHALGYYISARYAAVSSFSPVFGLLAHYAIEMFLKGRLSISRTEKELRDISHNLDDAWAAFKAEYPAEDLTRFDAVIAEIDRFWRIRYPERLVQEGMECSVDYSGIAGGHRPVSLYRDSSVPEVPSYHLSLHDLDELVRTFFDLSSLNPGFFLAGLREHGLTYLYLNNAFFRPGNSNSGSPGGVAQQRPTEETAAERGARLVREAEAGQEQLAVGWAKAMEQLGVHGPSIGALKLQEMMAAEGFRPEDNLLSRDIIGMREE
jgi:hypothetical protein